MKIFSRVSTQQGPILALEGKISPSINIETFSGYIINQQEVSKRMHKRVPTDKVCTYFVL